MYALVIVATLYLLLIGGFVLVFRAQRQHPKTASKIPLYSLNTSAVLAAAVLVFGFSFIFSSRSSTAGIGFLFVPIYALGVAIAGSIIVWAFLTLVSLASRIRARLLADKPTPIVAVVAVVVLLIGPTIALLYGPRALLLSEAKSLETPVQRLREISDTAVAENDLRALEVLARNWRAPTDVLEKVYGHCLEVVEELTATPCYAAFLHLAGHKNTPVPLSAKLASRTEISVRAGVARNTETPVPILQRLSRDEDARVRRSLAWNLNVPLSILEELTRDDDENVRSWAERMMKPRTNK